MKIYQHQKSSSKKRSMNFPDYTLSEFSFWIKSQHNFKSLWDNYVESGYDKWVAPSCDRLDDYKPYTLDNIRLVTWKENNIKSHSDIRNGVNNKLSKSVICIETGICYHSIHDAGRQTGIHRQSINAVCTGKRNTAGGCHWRYV